MACNGCGKKNRSAGNYARGANMERIIFKKLESDGFFAIRSAGSHDECDIVAIKQLGFNILLVQCKSSITETLPNTKDLLAQEDWKETKAKINGVMIRSKEWLPTNLKKLQELPILATKLIIWKGKGANNYWTFKWTPSIDYKVWTWKAERGLKW